VVEIRRKETVSFGQSLLWHRPDGGNGSVNANHVENRWLDF
jgi:hypothetical protein